MFGKRFCPKRLLFFHPHMEQWEGGGGMLMSCSRHINMWAAGAGDRTINPNRQLMDTPFYHLSYSHIKCQKFVENYQWNFPESEMVFKIM